MSRTRDALCGAMMLVGALLACTQGRTAGYYQPSAAEAIAFENLSADMVRVSVYSGGHESVLGRVGPFQRAALPLRARLLPPDGQRVCLVVVPVGAPSTIKPGPQSQGAIRSDFYPVAELARQAWTYSGSRILAASVPSR